MGTSTANLQLYKPDPTEMVDVANHLNANWDRLENKLVTTGAGPSCILRRDTNFTVPNVGDTAVAWTVQERNDSVGGLAMWTSGATGVTIRKAGTYTCGWRGVYSGVNAGSRGAFIVINGGDSGASVRGAPAIVKGGVTTNNVADTANGAFVFCSATCVLNVGDIVKAITIQDSGANLDIVSASDAGQGKMRFWVMWEPPFIGS